jgi:hypothetical protein
MLQELKVVGEVSGIGPIGRIGSIESLTTPIIASRIPPPLFPTNPFQSVVRPVGPAVV